MAKKKEKKADDRKWIDVWCENNQDELRRLGYGWATVHPKHGIVNHDTVGLVHLIGMNRFLKRSIVRECANIDVVKSIKGSGWDLPFTIEKVENACIEVKKEEQATRPDGLPKLDNVLTKIAEETKNDLGACCGDCWNSHGTCIEKGDCLCHRAKENPFPSPHKQPPYQPLAKSAFDRGIVYDGVTRKFNRTRLD